MIKRKIKKLLVYPLILLFIFTFTLAFIPHYSCGCGDEGNKKSDSSMLKHHFEKTVENIANAIRPIFN